MLKKIIAACAITLFFACSPKDDGFVYDSSLSSSSSQGNSEIDDSSSSSSSIEVNNSSSSLESSTEPSSSSKGAKEVLISNLGSAGGRSPIFNTYPYGYTLKASKDEDLTPFWKCPPEQNDTIKSAEAAACRLPQTDAILQNLLTTKDSPLHYIINNLPTENPVQLCIKLNSYNLKGAGDQAALGLDVDASKNGLASLAGVVAFTYYYNGGAHKFRIGASDADYWEASVPAVTEETLVTINISDLKGMGSLAENETPFDISRAAKFLWVVEFDAAIPANNTGSLLVYLFNGLVEQ